MVPSVQENTSEETIDSESIQNDHRGRHTGQVKDRMQSISKSIAALRRRALHL